MDRWFERIGFAAQWAVETARSAAGAAAERAGGLVGSFAEEVEEAAESGADALSFDLSPGLLAGTATAWLAGRFLRPSEVSWTRAVLAGIVGTLLYDAEMLLDQRLSGRKFDTIGPLGEALTDDPQLRPWAGWAAHYAAGIGLAALYARYLNDRLPGPPVVRGALFGALDAATLSRGGLLPLLSRAVPGVTIPPGYAGLAYAPVPNAQSLLRHTAYGIGVGLVYRPAPRFESVLPH